MRILLVAYEFPPSPSPQSLRWARLGGELAARGHEVHVLAPLLSDAAVPVEVPTGVHVHRCSAGPLTGLIVEKTRRWRERNGPPRRPPILRPMATGSGRARTREKPARLNWKGRVFMRVRRVAEWFLFPDIRGEWKRPMLAEFERLADALRPDVVITSHEPATTLHAGFAARARGLPWVADLGDPVCAAYTPLRFRGHARRLEARAWAVADAVVTTAEGTARELAARHGPHPACTVITQGFARVDVERAPSEVEFDADRLELLYTGSFYDFRRPDALVAALGSVQGIRLTVASIVIPDALERAAAAWPDRVRLLGFLPQPEAAALQARADVLLNLGNARMTQVPGKLYEYLGSGTPVLTVCDGPDEAARILSRTGAGWSCADDPGELAALLRRLRDARFAGHLGDDLRRDEAAIGAFAWDRLAESYEQLLAKCNRDTRVPGHEPARIDEVVRT